MKVFKINKWEMFKAIIFLFFMVVPYAIGTVKSIDYLKGVSVGFVLVFNLRFFGLFPSETKPAIETITIEEDDNENT